jgi:hypothetical protein
MDEKVQHPSGYGSTGLLTIIILAFLGLGNGYRVWGNGQNTYA